MLQYKDILRKEVHDWNHFRLPFSSVNSKRMQEKMIDGREKSRYISRQVSHSLSRGSKMLEFIGLVAVGVLMCAVHAFLFGTPHNIKDKWNVICTCPEENIPYRIERINIPLEIAEDYQKRNQKNNPGRVYLLEPYKG